MQYKKINKIQEDGLRKIGYALFNLENHQALTSGDFNALVVKSKVKDFEYIKGYTPTELSFEEIIAMILGFGGYYAFEKDVAKIFIGYLKEDFPEIYANIVTDEILNELSKNNDEGMVFGLPPNHNVELN